METENKKRGRPASAGALSGRARQRRYRQKKADAQRTLEFIERRLRMFIARVEKIKAMKSDSMSALYYSEIPHSSDISSIMSELEMFHERYADLNVK